METQIKDQLDQIVASFNNAYSEWSARTGCGANFRFAYQPESGHKLLEITDTSPLDPNMPKDKVDPRVLSAEDILRDALKEAVGGSGKP